MSLDCRTCGACCAAFRVELDAPEVPRFTRDRKMRRLVILDDLPRMLRHDGACIAHVGTVGLSSSCAIYKKRPNACRTVKKNDATCLSARKYAGLSA